MTEITELLEKVKAATGPDRDIDADLCAKLAPPVIMENWLSLTPRPLAPDKWERTWGGYVQHPDWWHTDGQGKSQAPTYTSSIDAAIALVKRCLPGWSWGVSGHSIKDGVYVDGPYKGKPKHVEGFRAHVTERSALRPMPSVADARTAPLAILTALLSALSSQAHK